MRRVPWSEKDGVRSPELPAGASYSVVEDHGDGTVTVEIQGDETARIAELEATLNALIDALAGTDPA